MDYLGKNLELLKEFDSLLYNRVCIWLKEESSENYLAVVEAKNGQPSIQIIQNDKARYLTSAYNPTQEAERWVASLPVTQSYIVHGFGLAYHIEELLKKDTKLILVVELNNEAFCLALKNRDLTWLFTQDNVRLSIAEHENTLKQKMMSVIEEYFNKFELVVCNSYNLYFLDEQTRVEEMLNEVIGNYILNENTVSFFGKQWTENFFKNLYPSLVNVGVQSLFDKFKDMPVVIVAAGPSLSKNVHLLKELKGKAVLLCVGTAYKVLENNGIKPDLLTSFDGSYKNYQIFEKLHITDVPLIYDCSIHHKIIEEYQGPLIPANMTDMFMEYFEERLGIQLGQVLLGSSIANIALDLAYKFGGNPIIFVGQDLAFTDGQTHSKGTIYENERVEQTGALAEVCLDGINGGKVLSNRSFRTFLHWFEAVISQRPDRTYINATEGGANIAGTEVMKLSEVMEKYCTAELPIEQTINNYLVMNSGAERCDIVEKANGLLKDIKDELVGFKKKTRKGLKLLDELEQLFKKPEVNAAKIGKILHSLDKLDEKLLASEDGKVFLHMIFNPLFLPLLKGRDANAPENETEEEGVVRIIRFNRNLYTGLREVSESVLSMVDETIETFEEKISRVS